MRYLIVSFVLLGFLASACNSGNRSATKTDAVDTSVIQRVRPAASGGTSAAYFTYTNTLTEPDSILGVSSNIAALTQIHEAYEAEDGLMGMREKTDLTVQPEETVVFKQGGLHVMFIQLNKDLSAGDTVSVTLQMSKAGDVEFKLPVIN